MVSIIIVSYNCKTFLLNCLSSIFLNEKANNFEIIIVDNNSVDGSKEELTKKYPEIKWIQLDNNIGFSKANNVGAKAAKGEYILFLNPDTYFIEPILDKCILKMEQDSKIGFLGCEIKNEDRSLQLSYHDGHKLFRKLIWRNPIVVKFFRGTFFAKKSIEKIKLKHKSEHCSKWLTGAFLFIKRETLLKNNFFWNESFFMYWEDVEICNRARKKGYKILYFPKVSIVHIGGSGDNVPLERFQMLEAAKENFIKITRGKFAWYVYRLMYVFNLKLELYLQKRKNLPVDTNSVFFKELKYYKIAKTENIKE